MLIKGLLTIVVRDKDTNRVKRIQHDENDITSQGYENLCNFGVQYYGSRIDASDGSTTMRLFICEKRFVEVPSAFNASLTKITSGAQAGSTPYKTLVPKTLSTPWYLEIVNRFNPGVSQRTIWGIGVTHASNNVDTYTYTYANLSTACVQETTDVLDVYYRIQVLENAADPLEYPIIALHDQALAEWIGNINAGTGISFVNYSPYEHYSLSSNIPPANYYNIFQSASTESLFTGTGGSNQYDGRVDISPNPRNYRYGQYRKTSTYSTSDNVGSVICGQLYGSNPGAVVRGTHVAKHVTSAWQPVQSIHKHKSTALTPFLDIDTLATGSGTLNATGTNWYKRNYPEFYRINITATGDVGTSRYAFYKRVLNGGFFNTTYLNFPGIPPVLPSSDITSDGLLSKYAYGHHLTLTSNHASITIPRPLWWTALRTEKVDDKRIAIFNESGVQVFNVRDNIYRLWNTEAKLAPALNVTAVRQIDTDAAGFTWVACANTGLHKLWTQEYDISAVTTGFEGKWTLYGDATSAIQAGYTIRVVCNEGTGNANTTFTVKTCTLVGDKTEIVVDGVSIDANATATGVVQIDKLEKATVAGVTDTNCYGVSAGYNGSVWAMFNGGLARTDDNGTTWTVYDTGSTPAFSYTGITDSNWSNVRFIRAQKDSQNFRIGIMVADNTNVNTGVGTVVWWSIAGTAITGPTIDYNYGRRGDANTYSTSVNMPGLFRVSDTGGWWQSLAGTSASTYGLSTLTWGTALNIPFTGSGSSWYTTMSAEAPGFVYDDYQTPYSAGRPIGAVDRNDVGAHCDRKMDSYSIGLTRQSTEKYGGSLSSGAQLIGEVRGFPVTLTKGVSLTTSMSDNALTFAANGWFLNTQTVTLSGGDIHPLNCATPTSEGNRHSQEWIWDRYHYDSGASAWKKNWYADAVDSINSYDGTRRLFDTESHFFTGRSTIQVPASALSTYFTSQLTFSARVTPQAKLADQKDDQILLSYVDEADPTNNFYLCATGLGSSIFLRYKSDDVVVRTDSTGVNSSTEVITSLIDHGWTTGDAVIYERRMGAGYNYAIGGITSGNIYYARVLSSNTFTLHPTPADAVADTNKINLTASVATYLNHNYFFRVHPFGTALTLAAAANIQLLVNGTSAKVYVNGVQSGTTQTLPSALDMSSATGRLVVGGIWQHPESQSFVNSNGMFRGTIANVLLDSVEWTGTEIAAYHAAPTTYAGIATTRVRYQLNEAFDGVAMARETKATHAGFEEILNGVDVKFTSGSLSPATSFVNTEYYTFGVVNGVLKDNATSYVLGHTLTYSRPTEQITDFSPATIPATTTNVTERITWRKYAATNLLGPITGGTMFTAEMASFQVATANFSHKWKTNSRTPTPAGVMSVGCSTLAAHSSGQWLYRVDFKTNFNVSLVASGSVVSADITTWDYNDEFEIRRSGSTFKFYKNGVELYTWVATSAAPIYMMWYTGYTNNGTSAHTITYDRPAYTVQVGNDVGQTGWFGNKFWNFDAAVPSLLDVKINGTPATVTVEPITAYLDEITEPALGTCKFVPDNGLLVFNSGDVGKTVTGRLTLLKTKI